MGFAIEEGVGRVGLAAASLAALLWVPTALAEYRGSSKAAASRTPRRFEDRRLPTPPEALFALTNGRRLFQGSEFHNEGTYATLLVQDGRARAAQARFAAVRGPDGAKTLLFDIAVPKRFRGQGLYHELFTHALGQVGRVDHAPILLFAGTNHRVFLARAFGGRAGLRRMTLDRVQRMSAEERQAFRGRLIAAAREMPAAKVRAAQGLGRVASIRFNPYRGSAIVDFARDDAGAPGPAAGAGGAAGTDEPRIFLSETPLPRSFIAREILRGRPPAKDVWEIRPAGWVRPVGSADDWHVAGYDGSRLFQFQYYPRIP